MELRNHPDSKDLQYSNFKTMHSLISSRLSSWLRPRTNVSLLQMETQKETRVYKTTVTVTSLWSPLLPLLALSWSSLSSRSLLLIATAGARAPKRWVILLFCQDFVASKSLVLFFFCHDFVASFVNILSRIRTEMNLSIRRALELPIDYMAVVWSDVTPKRWNQIRVLCNLGARFRPEIWRRSSWATPVHKSNNLISSTQYLTQCLVYLTYHLTFKSLLLFRYSLPLVTTVMKSRVKLFELCHIIWSGSRSEDKILGFYQMRS